MDQEKKPELAYRSFSYARHKDNFKNEAIYFFTKISHTIDRYILILRKVCMFAPQNQGKVHQSFGIVHLSLNLINDFIKNKDGAQVVRALDSYPPIGGRGFNLRI